VAGDFIQRSRHGTVFYFRRRVPLELRARLGRLQLYVSLRTSEMAEAKRRARALVVLTDKLFSELRYVQGGEKDGISNTDYTVELDFNDQGRPRFKVTDLKPGEESSAEDFAKRLLGLANGSPSVVATSSTPTVAEAMAAVLADASIKPSTLKEYRRAFEFFRDFVGAETRLGNIREERFSEFADHVRARDRWSAKTQVFYITSAQRLFTYYASRNSAVPKITTAGLKPKRAAPAGHDREEFSVDDFRALFANAKRYRKSEPAKWWVTVVPAFTGVRIEELAQAHIAGDFLTDPATGIHFLQIDEIIRDQSGQASPKSVKSQAGWRRVPIHPALVAAGFIDFLEDERARGAVTPFARTWPAQRMADGWAKNAHKITKWGGRELARLRADKKITKARVSYFHSMRHGFVTLLGKAGVEEEWRAAITGHQFGGINAQVYNKAKSDVSITLPKIELGTALLAEMLTA
jgi:hypothetical protein